MCTKGVSPRVTIGVVVVTSAAIVVMTSSRGVDDVRRCVTSFVHFRAVTRLVVGWVVMVIVLVDCEVTVSLFVSCPVSEDSVDVDDALVAKGVLILVDKV